MNIKRGLWRLAIVSSTAWTGGFLIHYFTDKSPNEEELWIGLSGGVVIWVGETTSAVNIGAGLAKLKKRVLLVDLDPQAHLTYKAR